MRERGGGEGRERGERRRERGERGSRSATLCDGRILFEETGGVNAKRR